MPSERVQRQIDALLEQAEAGIARREWSAVGEAARAVLAIDAGNEDAAAFLMMAAANLDGAGSPPAGLDVPPDQRATAAASVPDSFADRRYRVLRFLGEGGKKRVFLAHDERLDRDVAFALIKTEGLDATGRERVTREAQAMGRLGTHPHVVSIFDIGAEGESPYVVTELMSGGDVEGELERAGGPLPLARTLGIAKDVCRGLAFAHERGIVHRDLKPGNVWLTEHGTAKIGDFGLAVSLDRTRLTQHGMMVGTVAYMPPEQALGGEVTPQADLYSLGAMLYELVTGRPPFRADDATAVISQHINTPPVAPSYLSEHCPPELESLVLRCLAKVPADRPASAAEVLASLEAIDPEGRSPSHSGASNNPLDRLARGVFVGREHELERLRAAFNEAFAGHGNVVMLVGEPGIGKTRTAQELGTYARMRGAKVLWGRAHEASGAPSFWPWVQIGRDYAAQTDDAVLTAQLGDDAFELQRLFPNIRSRFPGLPPPTAADSEEAQFRLFDAFSGFFRGASRNAPIVLALDDLHWADRPTLRLLMHLCREIAHARVLVIGTYRDTDLDRQHPLALALAEMNREQLFSRVPLRGLTADETAAYIRDTTHTHPSRELVRRIHDETEGNPFFLSEVVNLMTEEGTLQDSVSGIAIPEGVKQALGRRLDRLSAEANELLGVAAVSGREFAHTLLRALTDVDDDTLLALVEEALDARVIEETTTVGEYRFTHALMQETLIAELSTARRVRIHGRIGETLERLYPQRGAGHEAELARHFVESAALNQDHAVRAAQYSLRAARAAAAVAAWDDAIRHLETCVSLAGDQNLDPNDRDVPALLVELAGLERVAGLLDEGRAHVEQALGLLRGAGDPAAFAAAALEAARSDFGSGRLRFIEEGLRALGPDGDPVMRASLLVRHPGEEALGEVAQIAREFELPAAVTAAVNSKEANVAVDEGRYEEALALLHRAHQLAVDAGDLEVAASARWRIARFLVSAGRLDEAAAASRADVEFARSISSRWMLAEGLAGEMQVEILRGRYEEAEALAVQVRELVPGSHNVTWSFMPAYLRGDLGAADDARNARIRMGPELLDILDGWVLNAAVLRGESASAAERFSSWAEGIERRWIHGWRHDAYAIAIAIEAVVALGDDAFVRDCYAELCRLPHLTCLAWSADVIRGLLALRLALVDEAEAHFDTGLAWCERERCPVEAGRCHHGLAEVAERRGNHALAMEHLDRAAALFSARGAKLYLDPVLAKKQILRA